MEPHARIDGQRGSSGLASRPGLRALSVGVMPRQIVWGAWLGVAALLGCGGSVLSDEPGQGSAARGPLRTVPAQACPNAVVLRVPYPGASLEEVEKLVTLPFEETLSKVDGLRRMESRSREGEAMVWLEFSGATSAENIRAHLAAKLGDTLPAGAEEPVILAASPPRFASTPVRVRGERSAASEVAGLLRGEGRDARVVGERARVVRVRLDSKRLESVGRTRQQIRAALASMPPPAPLPLGASAESGTDPVRTLMELELSAPGESKLRLADLATIEIAVAPTPIVLDASGDVGLIAVAGGLPAGVVSELPSEIQLVPGDAISSGGCRDGALEGLATAVAVRVDAPDISNEARRLMTALAGLDADVVALVGVSEGFGLDLTTDGADLHLLFPAAGPKEVLKRLRAQAGVEPLRVWGPSVTKVAVRGEDPQARALALRALQGALEGAGFFALSPEVAAKPEISFSVTSRAAALGLTAGDVARQVRSAVSEEPIMLLGAGDALAPVVLESDSDLSDPRELAELQLRTPAGQRVPLSAVANIELGQSSSVRWRVDRQAAVVLQTSAPRLAVQAGWAELASEHLGISVLAD